MAKGRERSEWNRAASIIAKVHNVNVTKESQCITFKQAHPFYVKSEIKKAQRDPTPEELALLERELGSTR